MFSATYSQIRTLVALRWQLRDPIPSCCGYRILHHPLSMTKCVAFNELDRLWRKTFEDRGGLQWRGGVACTCLWAKPKELHTTRTVLWLPRQCSVRRGLGHNHYVASRQRAHPLHPSQELLWSDCATIHPPTLCTAAIRPKISRSSAEWPVESIGALELTFVASWQQYEAAVSRTNIVSVAVRAINNRYVQVHCICATTRWENTTESRQVAVQNSYPAC